MQEQFIDNFYKFTKAVFQKFDWSNVCVAGGVVVGSVLPSASGVTVLLCVVLIGVSAEGFRDSDIDLFIYGLGAEAATAKLHQIIQYLMNQMNCTHDLVVSVLVLLCLF